MNWISSFKDKSAKLVSNISKKPAQTEEANKKPKENENTKKTKPQPNHGIELKEKYNRPEYDNRERNYQILLEIIKPFMGKKLIFKDKLQDTVELMLSNPDKYLRQDPTSMTMPSREDIPNFKVFYENNKPDEAFLTKMLTFDPTLPQLLITDDHMGHERKDNIFRFIMRFVYVIVYLLETGKTEKEKIKQIDVISIEDGDENPANKENEVSKPAEKSSGKNDKEKEKDKVELADRK